MIEITQHAYKRAKGRFGLKKDSFDRFVDKAIQQGIHHNECKGLLRKYVQNLILNDESSIVIYGEYLLFFNSNRLITVYALPTEYKKYTKL